MTLPTPEPMFSQYTVTRTAAGDYIDGRWVDGSTSTFTVMASIQPMRLGEVQKLPEALRTRETRKFRSDTAVRIANETNKTPSDTISVDGETWEVMQASHWFDHSPDLEHWQGVIARKDR